MRGAARRQRGIDLADSKQNCRAWTREGVRLTVGARPHRKHKAQRGAARRSEAIFALPSKKIHAFAKEK